MAIILFAFFSVFLLAAIHPFVSYPISLYIIHLWQRSHAHVIRPSPVRESRDHLLLAALIYVPRNQDHPLQSASQLLPSGQ